MAGEVIKLSVDLLYPCVLCTMVATPSISILFLY